MDEAWGFVKFMISSTAVFIAAAAIMAATAFVLIGIPVYVFYQLTG